MTQQTNSPTNDEQIKQLYSRLRERKYDLTTVASLVQQIIESNSWKKFVIEKTGQIVEHNNFLQFITQPAPEGLGTTYKNLWLLCQENEEVQKTLASLVSNQPIPEVEYPNQKTTTKPSTNRRLTRLEKEAQKNPKASELYKKVLDQTKGENGKPITAYSALIELGIVKPRISIPKTVDGAASKLRHIFNQEELTQLTTLLTSKE